MTRFFRSLGVQRCWDWSWRFRAAGGPLTLTDAMMAHAGGSLLECAGLCVVLRVRLPLRLLNALQLGGLRDAFVRSLPFAVVNITGILYLRTGTIALSKLAGVEQVAYFNTAGRLPEAALFVPVALVNAVLPFLSRHAGDRAVFAKYFDFLLRYILLAGCALAAFFLFEPRAVVLAVSKAEYLVAIPAFQLYGVWMLAAFVQYATTNLLICLDDERWVMRRYAMALGLNILLNLMLVPAGGVTGAAWAMVLSQVAATALDIKRLREREVKMRLAPCLQATVLTTVMAVVLAGEAGAARLAMAVIAAATAVGMIVWTEDRELVRRIIRRRESAGPAPAEPPDGS
jgi:O-antigen/teichoic acid export membrane protein